MPASAIWRATTAGASRISASIWVEELVTSVSVNNRDAL
jgi:hypothetical protein